MMIKEKPEDFFVKELIDLEFNDKGSYAYFILKKRDYNTLDAIQTISRAMKIPFKNFGYAGNKDKIAITEQYVSVDASKEKIESIKLKDIELKFVGRGNKRIKLGDNKGNFFRIKFKPANKYAFFENYFGEQRFGQGNIELGRQIVKKQIKNIDELRKDKNLKMYFHSYQSYLWNKVLKEYLSQFKTFEIDAYLFLKKKIPNFKIPIISFDTELKGEIGKIYEKVLAEEGVSQKDFIVKQFPILISDTVFRDVIIEVKDFKVDGEFVEFSLSKGCYATVYLRKLNQKI